MWFLMLISAGFNDRCTFHLTKLVQHAGAVEWERRAGEVSNDEAGVFAAYNVLQLAQHTRDLEAAEAWMVLVDGGKMGRGEYTSCSISSVRKRLRLPFDRVVCA